jgi:hypothetical protein
MKRFSVVKVENSLQGRKQLQGIVIGNEEVSW